MVHPFAGSPLRVCKGIRGRPALPLPSEVVQHWDVQQNGRPAPGSGRNSTEQAYFWMDCGLCSTKIQIKTACKQLGAAFECRVHSSSGRGISWWQRRAAAVLQQVLGGGSDTVSVEQYRALDIAQKPVDIVVEACGLFVEVDGPQHAASSSSWGEAVGAQCERDQQFERAVLRSGRRLLRLHWADAASWCSNIVAALRKCYLQPNSSFVYYSASYPQHRRVL